MAEENEDQWLYGDSNPEPPGDTPEIETTNPATAAEEAYPEENEEQLLEEPVEEPNEPENPEPEEKEDPPPLEEEQNEKPLEAEDGELNGDANAENSNEPNGNEENEEKMDDSDEDSDDDINVVINDIKTAAAYPSINIKRGNLLQPTTGGEKPKAQPGKFSIDEFESVGSINGVPAQEFNLDTLEDKPWRKPGADITDYFNYGFNEDTWRAYCERQKRMRIHESGAGLLPMNPGSYTGPRKAGPPPGRRMMGSIDVIGGNSGLASRRAIETIKTIPPKMSSIPVMTAERREYSRKPNNSGFPDVSVPPPGGPPGFDPNFNSFPDFYDGGGYGDYHSFEPTQEQQWGNGPSWAPNDIKQLTPGPSAIPPMNNIGIMQGMPPMNMPPQMVPPPMMSGQSMRDSNNSPMDGRSQDGYKRERDKESPIREHRDRDRESRARFEKDRHRERSHRRERSRSRSRRHKSRSRSPSHRSQHKKKKTKRHDKSDSD